MKLITIEASNIDTEHICCALGNDSENRTAAQTKKDWLKDRFAEGLAFRRLDQRGKVFIEYLPVEMAWKPIKGKRYILVNCLWVSGQFKGHGHSVQLLDACVKDARAQKMDGVCVVSSNKKRPFLTDKSFFLKQGFLSVDQAPPDFELLALSFKKGAVPPAFTEAAKAGRCGVGRGLAIYYSHQCPFMEKYTALLAERAAERGMSCKRVRLSTRKEAQASASPFGTLGIFYDGRFVSHELMADKKIGVFLDGLAKGS
jgi:hypothetical protein